MVDAMRRALTRVGVLTAHPAAFGVLLLYASLWFAFDRESLNWHAIATLATLFMTLFIQRSEHRDTQVTFASWVKSSSESSKNFSSTITHSRETNIEFSTSRGRPKPLEALRRKVISGVHRVADCFPDQGHASPSVSAMTAPRMPSGFSLPIVVSCAV